LYAGILETLAMSREDVLKAVKEKLMMERCCGRVV